MNWTEQAINKLREQQGKVKERSAPWMVKAILALSDAVKRTAE